MWFYWCIRAIGVGGVLKDIFGSKVKFPNPILNFTFVLVFFFVGLMEVFSIIVVRPIAFTFRLYGNIFGGETFLDSIYHNAPNRAFHSFSHPRLHVGIYRRLHPGLRLFHFNRGIYRHPDECGRPFRRHRHERRTLTDLAPTG